MLHDIVFALWFLLPVAAANVAPIISNVVPGLNRWRAPMDGGRNFRGKELFGKHKTWRGFVSGVVVATITLWLQQLLVRHAGWAQELTRGVDYASFTTVLLGPLFGVGALGGDALESFFKRQRGVSSGQPWIPFDQLDYIIGGVLVSLPFVILSAAQYIWIFVLWFLVHVGASYIGWRLKLKDSPI